MQYFKKQQNTRKNRQINNNKFRDRPHMIQAEFENGIEDENNFQIQEIDFQNGIDEDMKMMLKCQRYVSMR